MVEARARNLCKFNLEFLCFILCIIIPELLGQSWDRPIEIGKKSWIVCVCVSVCVWFKLRKKYSLAGKMLAKVKGGGMMLFNTNYSLGGKMLAKVKGGGMILFNAYYWVQSEEYHEGLKD